MRTINVEIELFEKGDRVSTPSGNATVLQNEAAPEHNWEIAHRQVRVKLDEPLSKYPNTIADLDAWCFSLLEE